MELRCLIEVHVIDDAVVIDRISDGKVSVKLVKLIDIVSRQLQIIHVK